MRIDKAEAKLLSEALYTVSGHWELTDDEKALHARLEKYIGRS